MPSPFPGMDPYLEDESLWPSFQHHLVLILRQMLISGLLRERYQPHIGERQYDTGQAQAGPGVLEEHREEYIEIRDRTGGQLITLLDVVSPANKTTTAGRQAYLSTRQEAGSAGANLVEIDLVLQGQPALDYSRGGLPDWNYTVTVTRVAQPGRYEIYTTIVEKRLPRFRLPLATDDRDTVLDLQVGFTRCYDESGFAERIDYRQDPDVPLREDTRIWLDDLLRRQQLRGPQDPSSEGEGKSAEHPSHEEISLAAYYLWQEAGCPHGHDLEHWYRAIKQLNHR